MMKKIKILNLILLIKINQMRNLLLMRVPEEKGTKNMMKNKKEGDALLHQEVTLIQKVPPQKFQKGKNLLEKQKSRSTKKKMKSKLTRRRKPNMLNSRK